MQLLHRVERGLLPWAWHLAAPLVHLQQSRAHWTVQDRLLLAPLLRLRAQPIPFHDALLELVAPWTVHHCSSGLRSASHYREVSDLAIRDPAFFLVQAIHLGKVLLQLLEDLG